MRSYLARERAWQDRLLAVLGADREQAARNQRLLFAWDGMSLALCLGWDDFVAEEVPDDVRVERLPDGRHVVEPVLCLADGLKRALRGPAPDRPL